MDPKDLVHYLDTRIETTKVEISNLNAKIETYTELKRIAEKEIK